MSISDPIADALTVLRNALHARHETTECRQSKMTAAILKILKEEGYIQNFKPMENQRRFKVYLKVDSKGRSPLHHLRRVSKPGRRQYVGCERIPRVLGGLGVAILSTSRGIVTGKTARDSGTGGELLCVVW